jgi:hypothetical protein
MKHGYKKNKACMYIKLYMAVPLFLLLHTNFSLAINYYTIAQGNWTLPATWLGGIVPGNTINAGDTVFVIHDVVYNNGNDLNINGALRITGVSFSTPKTGAGSGRSVFIRSTGSFYIYAGSFILPLFNGGSALSGSLINDGGKMYAYYSNIEIAQNWTPLNGAISKYSGGCLALGENYSMNSASSDSLISTCITIGLHGSGNFEIKSNSALFIINSKILLRGMSGNLINDVGCTVSTSNGGQIVALDVSSNLVNDGTWAVPVSSYCIDGSITGSNHLQVTSNLPSTENCALVNTDSCSDCNLIILPFKIISFGCNKRNENVLIKWQVSDESTIEKYEVQKSDDGFHYTTITTLLSSNSGTAGYSHTDEGIIYPVTYYRLCIVAKNGNTEYSEIRKVNGNEQEEKELLVFPTMFSNTLTVSLNSVAKQWCQTNLYNLQGALVFTQRDFFEVGNYVIILRQLSNLPSGIYLLNTVMDKQPQLKSRKLIKK